MGISIAFLVLGSVFCVASLNFGQSVEIYLYTQHSKVSFPLNAMKSIVSDGNFDRQKPTVMYIHGFLSDRNVPTSKKIVEAFRERGDHNILLCDYGDFSRNLYLSVVVPIAQRIAMKVAKRLNDFFDAGYEIQKFYLVGFSLGAQMSGLIGRTLKDVYGRELERITGLDSADPGFYPPLYENFQHISAYDAKFVDVIHTGGEFFGASEPTGTADFFPNGGEGMPGCETFLFNINLNPLKMSCSHDMAVAFFAESLKNPGAFPAVKASSYREFERGFVDSEQVSMGFGCPKSASGSYFLDTNEEAPYGRGLDGVRSMDETDYDEDNDGESEYENDDEKESEDDEEEYEYYDYER